MVTPDDLDEIQWMSGTGAPSQDNRMNRKIPDNRMNVSFIVYLKFIKIIEMPMSLAVTTNAY